MIHLRVICVIALTLLDRSKQTLKKAFPCFTLTGNVPRKGYTSASSSHRTRATFDGMSTATFPASDNDLEFLHEKWWRNGNSWFCLLKSWFKNHRSVLKTLTLGKKTLKFSGVTFTLNYIDGEYSVSNESFLCSENLEGRRFLFKNRTPL